MLEHVLVHANKGMNMLVLEHVPVRMVFYFFSAAKAISAYFFIFSSILI